MPRFELKQSTRHLTSYAGLALIGQCCEAAQVNKLDLRFPTSQGMKTSDLVKSYVGLLSLGKSDFEAIEPFRTDRLLTRTHPGCAPEGRFTASQSAPGGLVKEALDVNKVPSSVWLRQRLEKLAPDLREWTDELSVWLLQRTKAPITAEGGYVCLDFDTFVLDNSGTKKEWVSRTYQGTDGYTPIAAYLGNEGWCLALELRPGSQHSALETHYADAHPSWVLALRAPTGVPIRSWRIGLERVLPRTHALVSPDQAVLSRSDSGFDSARLLFQQDDERRAWAEEGRSFDYLVKWNPRKQDMAQWVARAMEADAWVEERPGKRVALLDLTVERAWQKEKRPFRLMVRFIERTIDAKGQHLLEPKYTLEGWWTSLTETPLRVIGRYCKHATHEQFHSDQSAGSGFGRTRCARSVSAREGAHQFKTDLDLERLPSGKFDCNDLVVHLGQFAYNCLRLIGQMGLTGDLSPVRHPAKRRRLKTVLQEIMYRAGQFIRKARKLILDFGRQCPAVAAFAHVQDRLLAAGRSP